MALPAWLQVMDGFAPGPLPLSNGTAYHFGGTLNTLAELYRSQRRYAEAEPLYRRSLAL